VFVDYKAHKSRHNARENLDITQETAYVFYNREMREEELTMKMF